MVDIFIAEEVLSCGSAIFEHRIDHLLRRAPDCSLANAI
jgi:hypothetical protein